MDDTYRRQLSQNVLPPSQGSPHKIRVRLEPSSARHPGPKVRHTRAEATAMLVFAQPLSGQAGLGPGSSYSYAQWLIRQGSPGSNA